MRSKILVSLAVLAFPALWAATAPAQVSRTQARSQSHDHATEVGRLEFDYDDGPTPTVEVDLKHSVLSALTGITESAIAGVTDALREDSNSPVVRESVEHVEAAQQILNLASEAVREVRVQFYDQIEDSGDTARMVEHYRNKLSESDWDRVVQFREDETQVTVCVQQEEEVIRGFFVIFAERNECVLANVVCDLEPERIRQITHQATQLGMKFGLEQAIESAMRDMNGHRPHLHARADRARPETQAAVE